jgi:hypothetical protein
MAFALSVALVRASTRGQTGGPARGSRFERPCTQVGDLTRDFDFRQKPRPPLLLPLHPPFS